MHRVGFGWGMHFSLVGGWVKVSKVLFLTVQERLFEADWPASLLEDAAICSRQGSLHSCGSLMRWRFDTHYITTVGVEVAEHGWVSDSWHTFRSQSSVRNKMHKNNAVILVPFVSGIW